MLVADPYNVLSLSMLAGCVLSDACKGCLGVYSTASLLGYIYCVQDSKRELCLQLYTHLVLAVPGL